MRNVSLLLLCGLSLIGCTGASDVERTGRKASAILGGTPDDTHKGVLAVENAAELCTGFAIGPDLVLTARHCVGELVNPGSPCIAPDGGTAVSAGATFAPSTIEVYSAANLAAPGTPLAAAEVIVPPDATLLCGNDVALLRLALALDPSLAIAPRLEQPPVVGESVTAIGYGASIGGPDTTSGVRRMRAGLTVTNLGPYLPRYVDGEWTISEGPCAGDSGSPALDEAGRAIGVMSRGSKTTCVDMIYERVDTHAAWLVDQARASYQRTGAPLPAWLDQGTDGGAGTGGGSSSGGTGGSGTGGTIAGGSGGSSGGNHATSSASSDGGCALGRQSRGFRAMIAVLGAVLLFSRRRRRISLKTAYRARPSTHPRRCPRSAR